MVDWKKDLKLSNLLARDKREDVSEDAQFDVEAETRSAGPKETPFWKRELTFRRRPEQAVDETPADMEPLHDESEPDAPESEAVAAESRTPFWKRELKLGRRNETDWTEDDVAEEPFASDETESTERRPFWKRDLGFGRSSDPLDDVQDDDSTKTPFWKRELSFGRREEAAESPEPEDVEAATDDAGKRSFFRRDLGFGRRRDATVDETPDAMDPEAEREPESTEHTPFWKRELIFGRKREADSPEGVEAASDDVEKPSFFGRDFGFGRRRADTVDEPADAAEPAPGERETFTGGEAVTESREAQGASADEAAEPTPFDTAEAAQPEEVLTGEPEPAAAPGAEPAEDTPFWKRELSFGSSEDPDFDAPETDKRPFFKRDFSFRRAKAPDFAEPEAARQRKPFWKRDFSFGRTKSPEAAEPEAARERKPFWKRELSLRRGAPTGRTSKGGRKKQLVGLKVGASQIAAARVVNNGSPELLQLARQPIEPGIVVGGELRDPDALAEALREFFADHKLPGRNVRLGIGNNRIGVRTLEISGVHDPKQLENAIRFRAQEALPIPLDEAVLDYHVIDETVSPTGIRTYEVLLVVAYRELIDRFVAACRGAGLRLVGIDLEAFALLRALAPPESESLPEDTALVAVAIGHDRSTFAVSNGRVCEFTRVLDWGGSSLNTAIARALDITPSQAEPVKRTLSLGDGGESASNNEHTIRATEAVKLELQSFARELVSSLHFYQNQPGSLAIGTIILTGGTAHIPGLAAELQRLIGVKVRVGDPLRRLKTGKRVEEPDQVGSMSVAIGLGIED